MSTGSRPPAMDLVLKTIFSALSIALVFLGTYSFVLPIPATAGYFNFGDIMIFVCALTFGPLPGAVGGGLGSALSDLIGFPTFAPFTLVIKGLEGAAAGWLSHRKTRARLRIAWLVAGSIMVGGYFLTESVLIALLYGASETTGVAAALGELPFNVLQVSLGGLVGIPISHILKVRFPTLFSSRTTKPGNPT